MLAIAGGKGGCGKTTTAVGLARALAIGPPPPLVIDGDRDMPNLHRIADAPRPDLAANGDPPPRRRAPRRGGTRRVGSPPDGAVRSRRFPDVYVLPARSYDRVEAVLDRAAAWDGPVLVDCPAGASVGAALPLRFADATVLVTTAAPESVEDAIKTAAMAEALDADPTVVAVRDGGPARIDRIREATGWDVVTRIPERGPDPLDQPPVRSAYVELSRTVTRIASPAISGVGSDRNRVPENGR